MSIGVSLNCYDGLDLRSQIKLMCVGNVSYILERFEEAQFCWDIGHEYCFTSGMAFCHISKTVSAQSFLIL